MFYNREKGASFNRICVVIAWYLCAGLVPINTSFSHQSSENTSIPENSVKSAVLFYNYNDWIMSYDLNSGKIKHVVKSGVIDNLDYDVSKKIVYWSTQSNGELKGVFRSYVPGAKNGQVTVGHCQHVAAIDDDIVRGSLKLDWETNNIYWLSKDIFNSTVVHLMGSLLDGRHIKTFRHISDATSFVYDAEKGYRYWSVGGARPHIHFDELNVFKLLLDNQNPVALTIDYMTLRKLYWADSVSGTIYYTVLNVKKMIKLYTPTSEHTPVAMDIFENNIYWLTRDSGEILLMNKLGGGIAKSLVKNVQNGSVIKISDDLKRQTFRKPRIQCLIYCTHMCVFDEGFYLCACPDGSKFERRSGEKLCSGDQEEPLEAPLECNCNDKEQISSESSPYHQCDCSEHLRLITNSPSIILQYLIYLAIIYTLFITAFCLSSYKRAAPA